jgi:16S rRNA (cytidine1402-2'-O)-methyltransferase
MKKRFPRGEIVILVAPPEERAPQAIEPDALDAMLALLAQDMPAAKAAAEASRRTGLAKGDLFNRINAIKTARDAGSRPDGSAGHE